jgi:hypothetical protein
LSRDEVVQWASGDSTMQQYVRAKIEQDPEAFDVIDTNADGYIQLGEFDIGT